MAAVAAVAVMLLVGALWNLTSLCERVADAEWERDKLLHDPTNVPALIAEVRRLTAALATVTTERDALLAVCERFAGDEGVICNGYEDDSGCGSCGANANHSDADPANHAPDCARLAARVLAAKIRALPLDAPGGAPDCTGITAQWCPRCGDCTCPLLHEGNVEGERTLDDPRCPLHAPSSPHGDAPGGAT